MTTPPLVRRLLTSAAALVILTACVPSAAQQDDAPTSPSTTRSTPPESSAAPAPAVTSAPEQPAPEPEPAPTHIEATPADARPFSATEPIPQELSLGMQSPLVRELQVRLRHARYLAIVDVTSKFGPKTQEGVINFQREHGLPVTGVVGQLTWDALLPKSYEPTEAELNNTDIGPWYTGPTHAAFVMELQTRLAQVGMYGGPIDGIYSPDTRAAIAAYRGSVGLTVGEVMDERAWVKLRSSTRNPSYAELFAAPPASTLTQDLDQRCLTGKVVCISKEQLKLSYVVDGQVLLTREARFARPGWESPVGDFRVWHMNADQVSDIFGERTPMPYAIFYHGDVAIHFSDSFADTGYESGSHGCTQLKDYQVQKWLFEQMRVGDRVVVY